MILNSRNNNFILNFPKNFLYTSVQDKYTPILKRLPYPYDTVTDYLNASIQQFTLPSVSVNNVSQTLSAKEVDWKGPFNLNRNMDREFTITFKSYEGYLNYWLMFDNFREFLSYDNTNEYFPNITLSFLDNDGFELISMIFKQVTMTSISQLDLDFSSNTPDFQTFTCDFTYNYMELKNRLD